MFVVFHGKQEKENRISLSSVHICWLGETSASSSKKCIYLVLFVVVDVVDVAI